MVYAKTELFEADLQSGAELFKALGHPARLAILKYLAETKTCIIGDIADELPLSRTTVNQHLKELKDSGMIVGKISGAKTCYCLNIEKVKTLEKLSNELFSKIISSESYNCK
jgi:ArsR family transcriptional regulator